MLGNLVPGSHLLLILGCAWAYCLFPVPGWFSEMAGQPRITALARRQCGGWVSLCASPPGLRCAPRGALPFVSAVPTEQRHLETSLSTAWEAWGPGLVQGSRTLVTTPRH